MIEESKATAVFSRIIAPIAEAKGYRATRRQRGTRQSPVVEWEKQVGDVFVLRVHLQPGKSPRFHYVNLNLYAKVSAKGKRAKSRKAVLLGRLEELVPPSKRLTYDRMFDCESSYSLEEREHYIAGMLRIYGLPTLESLADYETVVEAYLAECVLVDGRWFGSLQPDAEEYFQPVDGSYMAVLDLPVLGDPSSRLTDDSFRNGRVALLNVWTVESETCRVSHKQLMSLHEEDRVDIYGIADRDTPQEVVAFLEKHGNPYIQCGLELDGVGSRIPCGILPIVWRRDWGGGKMPLLMVVDGNGIQRHFHAGPITDAVLKREILPAIEEAGRPYSYIPRRARKFR